MFRFWAARDPAAGAPVFRLHRQTSSIFQEPTGLRRSGLGKPTTLEKEQLEDRLGTDGLVSLTDFHDDIEAGSLLAIVPINWGPIPISVEVDVSRSVQHFSYRRA